MEGDHRLRNVLGDITEGYSVERIGSAEQHRRRTEGSKNIRPHPVVLGPRTDEAPHGRVCLGIQHSVGLEPPLSPCELRLYGGHTAIVVGCKQTTDGAFYASGGPKAYFAPGVLLVAPNSGPLLKEEQMVYRHPSGKLHIAVHPRPAQHKVELIDEVVAHVVR